MKKLKWLFGMFLMVLLVCGSEVSVEAEDIGVNSETETSDFFGSKMMMEQSL